MDEHLQRLKRDYVSTGDPAAAIRFANAVIRSSGEEPPERQRTLMNIPTVGTELQLAADWTFPLWSERRNSKFWESINGEKYPPEYLNIDGRLQRMQPSTKQVVIPAETVLKVSRIYIRQGQDTFDSVTFSVVSKPKGSKFKGRFWAKLEDVNTMLVNWDVETMKVRDKSNV